MLVRSSCSRSWRPAVLRLPVVAVSGLLLVLLLAESCSGFALQGSPSVAGAGQGRRSSDRRQATAVVAPGGRLFAEGTRAGGDASAAAVATERVRPHKVVKPWLTKAQETVDYSNVEAM